MIEQSTICAISTPAGVGGIAVIRISGKNAIEITDNLFTSPTENKKLISQSANTLHFGTIIKDENLLDEVVVGLFKAPHSFTGEDIVEISCHGSLYIQQTILQLLIANGACMAKPGEFTQRAFLNGKMDLSQAEAVADLISSSSSASHKLAINQMRGGFSKELIKLRAELLNFVSLIELELDFGEEEVEFADRTELNKLATHIEETIGNLADSFSLGNAIKNGIPVAIIGETNVGKSTLLNAILKEEKAIVSDIHGTTRDAIEDVINLEGLAFRFIDTAGLRHTKDKIETLGIERTYQKLEQATIVLFLMDLMITSEDNYTRLEDIRKRLTKDQHLIIVGNKADKAGAKAVNQVLSDIILADKEELVFISAKRGQNIDHLTTLLLEAANYQQVSTNDVIVTNIRHYEALVHARKAINRALAGLDTDISADFLAQDIRECIHYLGEITGEISTDEVLGNIFANFCIGK